MAATESMNVGANNIVNNNNTATTKNNNHTEFDSSKNDSMTSTQNTSYEDDFEKDSSRLSDSKDSHNNSSSSKVEDSYEDDFEKDLSADSSFSKGKPFSSEEKDSVTSPASQQVEPPQSVGAGESNMSSVPSDNESEEPDADAYNFTEDQRRAMLELMVQKQEDVDLLDEEPPEYNVKGLIEEYNERLARSPTPVEGERETRVMFKPELVDLVAPPPQEFSDEDNSQPNSARSDAKPDSGGSSSSPFHSSGSDISPSSTQQSSQSKAESAEAVSSEKKDGDGRGKKEESEREEAGEKKSGDDPNKKEFVVERDGQFSVLSASELTPSERAMLMPEEDADANNLQTSPTSKGHDEKHNPRPPAQPRPKTTSSNGRRNMVRNTGQASPRPKSADHKQQQQHQKGSNEDWNFTYESPYARTPELKEQSREHCRKQEQERREREQKKREEEQQRREYNDSAYHAWLNKKKEEQQKQTEADKQSGEKPKSQEERSSQDEEVKENDDAFKTWCQEKKAQGKREKLLARRQQQEQTEGFFLRPREECERAFKEWLRKKNSELRRQHAMEQQRTKMYRVQYRRSRKTQALVRALKESQAFRYVDYYGYRY